MITNIFKNFPDHLKEESFENILTTKDFDLERILSFGQASPPGFWYEQSQDEWILLLQGAARLAFKGKTEPVSLQPGDYLLIPAGKKHRVDWTKPQTTTMWLALHFKKN